jgi:hypothetical protein
MDANDRRALSPMDQKVNKQFDSVGAFVILEVWNRSRSRYCLSPFCLHRTSIMFSKTTHSALRSLSTRFDTPTCDASYYASDRKRKSTKRSDAGDKDTATGR